MITIDITTSTDGEKLNFVADSPNTKTDGGTIYVHDVYCDDVLLLRIRDVQLLTGTLKVGAIGVLAGMTDPDTIEEIHFTREGEGCVSPPIKTPHTVKHTQELDVTVVAYASKADGMTLGDAPKSQRGRLPIKVIRTPHTGGE